MIERPLHMDDLEGVLAVRTAVEVDDALPVRTPLDEVEEELGDEGVDLAADSLGVFGDDGTCLAYGWVSLSPEPSPQGWRAIVHVAVHPEATRQGHGRRLLARLEARARTRLEAAEDHPGGRVVALYVNATQDRANRMAELAGFRIGRYFDEMSVRLDGRPHIRPWDGGDVVAWDEARSEAARELKNDAFADHWGSSPTTPEAWVRMTRPPRFQPALSTMALEGDRLVGIVMTLLYPEDWEAVGREEAWIAIIGVPRSHRGRGIATAMIDRTLQAAAASGLSHTSLGVDTANPTGAHRLYADLGFTPTARTHLWVKPVDEAATWAAGTSEAAG